MAHYSTTLATANIRARSPTWIVSTRAMAGDSTYPPSLPMVTPEWAKAKGASNCWIAKDCRLTLDLARFTPLTLWAIVAVSISSCLSFYVHIFGRSEGSYRLQHVPVYPYRRPDPYTNFRAVSSSVNSADSTTNSIDTTSQLVLQIDNTDPTRRTSQDHRTHWTEQGTVYPEDRHFRVTQRVRVFCLLFSYLIDISQRSDIYHCSIQSVRLGDGEMCSQGSSSEPHPLARPRHQL